MFCIRVIPQPFIVACLKTYVFVMKIFHLLYDVASLKVVRKQYLDRADFMYMYC